MLFALARRRWMVVFGLFLVVVLIVYGASLRNGFVIWDDDTLVYQNPLVLHFSWHSLKGVFTSYDPELYIPLTLFTYQIEHLFFGLYPLPYHLTNLLLHTINAVLVVQLLRTLGSTGTASILCGLLFLVHPLNTEAVAWVSARKDVLCATFFLASLLSYIRYRDEASRPWFFVAIVFALLALLSKPTAVMLPAAFAVVDVYRLARKREVSPHIDISIYQWKPLIPFVVLSVIFFAIALFGKAENVAFITPFQTLLLAAKSAIFSLRMLFWPSGISSIYQQTGAIALSSLEFYAPLMIVIALSLAALVSARRHPALLFGWSWFLLLLLPSFANFAKEGDVYFAGDRYPYLAQIGVLIFLSTIVERIVSRFCSRRGDFWTGFAATGMPFILALSMLGIQSHDRSLVWRDSEMLFRDALTKNMTSWEMHYHLGLLAHRRNDLVEAEAEYRNALDLYPRASGPLTNLGILLRESGRASEGEAQLRLAAETGGAPALNALGSLLMDRGHIDEAIDLFERAIARDPQYAQAYVNVGHAYGKQERYAEAIDAFRNAAHLENVDTQQGLLRK